MPYLLNCKEGFNHFCKILQYCGSILENLFKIFTDYTQNTFIHTTKVAEKLLMVLHSCSMCCLHMTSNISKFKKPCGLKR